MSTPTVTAAAAAPVPALARAPGRSIAAVFAALVANVVLSLATDQVFHTLGVYPPWGQPMYETTDNLLALGYRTLIGILTGYLVARLAPSSPMRHVKVLGAIAVVLATAGALATLLGPDLGPAWYPIALAITAYPCVWLGGFLFVRRASH